MLRISNILNHNIILAGLRGPQPRNFVPWLRAARAFSFPLSVLPVFVTTAFVLPMSQWRWDILLASVFSVIFMHAAGNLLNDYFDFRTGVDRKIDGDEGRPGRLLVRGDLKLGDVLTEAIACLVLAVPPIAYLAAKCGPAVLWFAGIALLALYAYTGPPFRIKYRALGEPLIFIVLGPLLVTGAAYAQTGRCDWSVVLLSVPIGMVTTAVLLGNNIRDAEEDRSAGITTLAHQLGLETAIKVYILCVLIPPLAIACLAVGGILRAGTLLCLTSLAPACFLVREALSGQRIPDVDARTARYAAIFFLTLWIGMALLSR